MGIVLVQKGCERYVHPDLVSELSGNRLEVVEDPFKWYADRSACMWFDPRYVGELKDGELKWEFNPEKAERERRAIYPENRRDKITIDLHPQTMGVQLVVIDGREGFNPYTFLNEARITRNDNTRIAVVGAGNYSGYDVELVDPENGMVLPLVEQVERVEPARPRVKRTVLGVKLPNLFRARRASL